MRPLTTRAVVRPIPTNRICHTCLLQRRTFASPPAPPNAGLAPLSSRGLLSVGGPDAAKFLQGIITQNVVEKDGSARRTGCYGAFLNAKGRVMHDVFIYPGKDGFAGSEEGTGFLIEGDVGQMDALARFIKRYKLRAKVNVRKIDAGEVSIWQAWGAEPPAPNESSILLQDLRTPDMGYRILQLGDESPKVDLDTVAQDSYTIRRYLRGVPEGQNEIPRESALPQENNMDFMNGIDWHKGCYVGQELTIRTKHRGIVRKRMLPCVIYPRDSNPPQSLQYNPSTEGISADQIPPETSIGRFEKRGRSAGKWLGGVGNVGLGLCRLEIMTGTELPGETPAETWDETSEFVLEWGAEEEKKGVKVKAFVPEWIQQGLDAHAASRR